MHIEWEGGVGWGLDISYSDILCNIFFTDDFIFYESTRGDDSYLIFQNQENFRKEPSKYSKEALYINFT